MSPSDLLPETSFPRARPISCTGSHSAVMVGLNFNLLEQLTFYGAYHTNKWNQVGGGLLLLRPLVHAGSSPVTVCWWSAPCS